MLAQTEIILLATAFFLVALLYSSVGFGGGSSYLALLALVFANFFMIRSSALLCNLVVVSGSSFLYFQRGHLQFKKFVPFLITSIPLAFVGALFKLKEHFFFILLGISLLFAAFALVLQTLKLKGEYQPSSYSKYLSYLLGGAVGFLSGMVGIGGGIFLAPILNHMKWDKPLVIAALASFFILVNSISGILGLLFADTFIVPTPDIWFLIVAVFLGGQLGARLSLGKLSGKTIRLLTALLVLVVGIRVLLKNGFQLTIF
ncbi:sulfite exporter TauE/SafE family protein [Croceivirga thetidis]|uniref:Probable membrane transporter protein n=1 Tax=Croceivirga thetidis TaxID=2721623 RepID=A0ABX1GU87_9FLAO|nr:sulfite exporter TauE/SafE family protein [Croceivirga thetidis]NKI32307.1 sulfite exporter TauE/SafE family protein [Croceivirga thetidis]